MRWRSEYHDGTSDPLHIEIGTSILARLRLSDYVAREDMDESICLTHMSKASLLEDDYHDGSRTGAVPMAIGG